MYRQITATDLAARIGSEDPPFVLDVRNPDEHEAWKIATSVNIPVTELADRLGELPAGTALVVHCAARARSAQPAAVLVDAGFDVAQLSGGMGSWAEVYATPHLPAGPPHVMHVRLRATRTY